MAPGVNEAVCTGGELHPPTLTPVTTDGITYSYDPPIDPAVPYYPNQTVLVTATLKTRRSGWPPQAEMPEGWTNATPTTATTR